MGWLALLHMSAVTTTVILETLVKSKEHIVHEAPHDDELEHLTAEEKEQKSP